MNMRGFLLLLLLAVLSFSSSGLVMAEEELPDGHIMFRVSHDAELEFVPDTLEASVSFGVEQAADHKALQEEVMKTVDAARKAVDAVDQAEFFLGAYSAYEKGNTVYGSQVVLIRSSNVQALSALLGEFVSQGAGIENISYMASSAQKEMIERDLTRQGIATVQNQAEVAAENLGKKSFDIRDFSVHGVRFTEPFDSYPQRTVTRMDASALIPAPGFMKADVSLNALVHLKP
jgi:uncharacterized protein YggE